jgi:MFS family permease
MLVGLVLGLAGAITVALTHSLVLMGLAAFFYGLGMGVWGLARLIHLAETVPVGRRGRAIAPVGGMYRIGMFVGPGVGGLAAEAFGRQVTVLMAAALVALSGVIVALGLNASEAHKSRRPHSPLRAVKAVVQEHGRILLTAGSAMWALSLLRAARMLLLPVCGSVLGLETASIGFVKSASAFADMLLFYPAGQMMDRRGRKWTALPCLVTLSIGVLLISLADSEASLLVGGLVAGVGNGFGSGINMTLAGDFSPDTARADFIGVWRLMSDAGAALSPFVMGGVAHAVALGAAGIVPFGVGLLGALVFGLYVREPLHARKAQG